MTKLTSEIIQELDQLLTEWSKESQIDKREVLGADSFLNWVERKVISEHQEQEQEADCCYHNPECKICPRKPPTQEPKTLDNDDFVITYLGNGKWLYGLTHLGMIKLKEFVRRFNES